MIRSGEEESVPDETPDDLEKEETAIRQDGVPDLSLGLETPVGRTSPL